MAPPAPPPFTVFKRPQFEMVIDNRTYVCILNQFATGQPAVNNAASFLTRVRDRSTRSGRRRFLVKLVVGPPDLSEPGAQQRLRLQVARARQVFQGLHVQFQQRDVAHVFNVESATGTPGASRRFFSSLLGRVVLRESYLAEGNLLGRIFDVGAGQLDKAVAILTNPQDFPPLADPCKRLCQTRPR